MYLIIPYSILVIGVLYCDEYSSFMPSEDHNSTPKLKIPTLSVELSTFSLCKVEGERNLTFSSTLSYLMLHEQCYP